PAQGRLLDVAELARHALAHLVLRVDPDLDPVRPADLEADPRQRRGRLGDVALPLRARADEVADLEPARPDARMETRAAEHLGLVRGEDSHDEVVAGVELGAERLEQVGLLLERLRLRLDPRHPRPEMVEARVDRVLDLRSVARVVAADDETLRLDAIRSGRSLPRSHQRRRISVTPSRIGRSTHSTRSSARTWWLKRTIPSLPRIPASVLTERISPPGASIARTSS